MPLLTILLPAHRDAATLPRAWESVRAQTLREWRLLLLLNDADEATARCARDLAQGEPRAQIIDLPGGNLATTLQAGLRLACQPGQARTDLVARMDADDWSHPDRLDEQVRALESRPHLLALGCGWDVWDNAMARREREERPPVDEREARWRLLLGNPYAHGSMLLRARGVLEAGGYDPACSKAQDYDLWLRLGERCAIGGVRRVLYRYRAKAADAPAGPQRVQARVASERMVRAWSRLPFAREDATLTTTLALAGTGELSREEAMERLGELLTQQGPTREGLMAYLWLSQMPSGEEQDASARAIERAVREASELRPDAAVWLYPAGRMARRVLRECPDLRIAGLIDDDPSRGAGLSMLVRTPEEIHAPATVILASRVHEPVLWEASAGLRARGVDVVRPHAQQAGRGTTTLRA